MITSIHYFINQQINHLNNYIRDPYYFYESKSCLICRMTCVVTLYLYNYRIKSVKSNIPKQSIQNCTPLVNTKFAPGIHSDLMTWWRPIEIRTNRQMWYNIAVCWLHSTLLSSIHCRCPCNLYIQGSNLHIIDLYLFSLY